jgi:hypothetical protein
LRAHLHNTKSMKLQNEILSKLKVCNLHFTSVVRVAYSKRLEVIIDRS